MHTWKRKSTTSKSRKSLALPETADFVCYSPSLYRLAKVDGLTVRLLDVCFKIILLASLGQRPGTHPSSFHDGTFKLPVSFPDGQAFRHV